MKRNINKAGPPADYFSFQRFKVTHSIVIFSLALPKKSLQILGEEH